ncbi:hypothetical protein GCM10009787_22400 [Streptomyces bangladeshensis]|uniref:Secreted protein n=1 Tax=Streptomyces bangladeshensis TaxID=295352 RepID=A0ABN3BFG7_9ACTN
MATGPLVSVSTVMLTSAEPSCSVRSVARASAAIAGPALSAALTVFFALSVPQPEAATSAAAVKPTQTAVFRFLMSPPLELCACCVRGALYRPRLTWTRSGGAVRIPDG